MKVLKTTFSILCLLTYFSLGLAQDQQEQGLTKEQLFEFADNTENAEEDRIGALDVLAQNLDQESDLRLVLEKLKAFSYDDSIGMVIHVLISNAGRYGYLDLVKESMDYITHKGHPEIASFGFKDLIKDGSHNAYIIEQLKAMDDKNPIVYIDVNNEIQFSAMQAATQYGNLEVVKFIAENVQQPEDLVWDRPLHVASKYGHLDIVKYITENFDFKTLFWTDEGKDTPLHNAAIGGHVDILEHFANAGVTSMNPFDAAGFTPLHLAAGEGHLPVVQAYLTKGASADLKLTSDDINKGRTLLHLATEGNHTKVVDFLLSYPYIQNPNPQDAFGVTPLHIAAQLGFLKIFKDIARYVGQNANPKAFDKEPWLGRNLLHLAAMYGHLEILEHMKNLPGVNLMDQDATGLTAMHLAAETGRVETLQFFLNNLLDNYNNPQDGGENKRTPLHLAAQNGHLNAVWLLAKYYNGNALKINAIDAYQYTPLNLAAYNGHLGVVHYLISQGSDPDLNGISSTELAYGGQAYDVLEFLLLREQFEQQATTNSNSDL